MKKIIFLLLCFLIMPNIITQAQDAFPPCQQVKVIDNPTKQAIVEKFVSNAVQNNYFINDKGIIHLNIYKNKEGRTCWILIPVIDDRYKDNPPTKFSEHGGDIILVYDADVQGNTIKTTNPEPFIKCMEQIIGDRVYLRPTTKLRWGSPEFTRANGQKVRPEMRRFMTGNAGEVIIIFNEDGTYKKIIPG